MVVVAATLWLLFSAYLLARGLGLPRIVERAAAWLLGAELLALAVWGYGSETCVQRPSGTLPELARAVAFQDVPALTVVVLALFPLHPLRLRLRGRRAPLARVRR